MQQSPETRKNFRHNFTVNVTDGAFFGLGLGFASFETIIPLFLSTMTSSAWLIGLVSSLHSVGWQLPQLLTSGAVARLSRYKPWVMLTTIHERWPFFGLAIIALVAGSIDVNLALALAVLMTIIHSFGAGIAGTAWQSMIHQIMPPNRRGTFFGSQASAANLLSAGAAVVAGFILERLGAPYGFAICFFITGVAMMISMAFLAMTREEPHEPLATASKSIVAWAEMKDILRRDLNFRWFLVARSLSQVAWAVIPFYTLYAVQHFKMDAQTAGLMTGILMLARTISNPLMGYIGDLFGYRRVMVAGALMMTASVALAMVAPSLNWFYLVFALAGFSQATMWAIAITFSLEFGEDKEKPLYIGMSNTLVAPATILAPIVGGVLADRLGFGTAFLMCTICGLLAAGTLLFFVRDPRPLRLAQEALAAKPVSLEDSGVFAAK